MINWSKNAAPRENLPSVGVISEIACFAVFAFFFANYFADSIGNLFLTWRSDHGYDHGPLVALFWLLGVISIYWHQSKSKSSGHPWLALAVSLAILAAIGFFNKVAEKLSIEVVQNSTMAAFLILSVWLLLRSHERLRFGMLSIVLLSGVPIWGFLIYLLQPLVIFVTEIVMTGFRVPVYFSGSIVILPYGPIEIAEGCSGLRYLLSALAYSAMYVFFYITDWKKGALLILITCISAIIMNAVRVISVIFIGYASKMESALVQDHHTFGWMLFAFVLIPSLLIGQRMRIGEGESSE